MKLPRDVSGPDLVQALRKLGYQTTRQKGSHIRVTTDQNGQHHEVIPNHSSIKPGTLHGILKSVAAHHKMTLEELVLKLNL
jgi:predicted RNA binding protein YcfA (HicA-like mRNA interferase family)